jgi:hypothetical protein
MVPGNKKMMQQIERKKKERPELHRNIEIRKKDRTIDKRDRQKT